MFFMKIYKVIVSSMERNWKRLKAWRPSRPGNYVSHLDKVIKVWAMRIMSSPQWRDEQRGWAGSVWNIRYHWRHRATLSRKFSIRMRSSAVERG